jgi:hypothetical protein
MRGFYRVVKRSGLRGSFPMNVQTKALFPQERKRSATDRKQGAWFEPWWHADSLQEQWLCYSCPLFVLGAGIKGVGRQSFILQRVRERPGAIAAD